jgi:hypothetical protein
MAKHPVIQQPITVGGKASSEESQTMRGNDGHSGASSAGGHTGAKGVREQCRAVRCAICFSATPFLDRPLALLSADHPARNVTLLREVSHSHDSHFLDRQAGRTEARLPCGRYERRPGRAFEEEHRPTRVLAVTDGDDAGDIGGYLDAVAAIVAAVAALDPGRRAEVVPVHGARTSPSHG